MQLLRLFVFSNNGKEAGVRSDFDAQLIVGKLHVGRELCGDLFVDDVGGNVDQVSLGNFELFGDFYGFGYGDVGGMVRIPAEAVEHEHFGASDALTRFFRDDFGIRNIRKIVDAETEHVHYGVIDRKRCDGAVAYGNGMVEYVQVEIYRARGFVWRKHIMEARTQGPDAALCCVGRQRFAAHVVERAKIIKAGNVIGMLVGEQ